MDTTTRQLWRSTFAVGALVLTAGLVYILAFAPLGGYAHSAYVLCAVAALVCIYAAWKLHDAERTKPAVEGAWLARVNLPGGELDD